MPRPADRAADLVGRLSAAGAAPEVVELITIGPPADAGTLDLAVLALSRGDFVGRLHLGERGRRRASRAHGVGGATGIGGHPGGRRRAGTAAAVRAAGLPVDLVPPDRGSAAALAAVFPHARSAHSARVGTAAPVRSGAGAAAGRVDRQGVPGPPGGGVPDTRASAAGGGGRPVGRRRGRRGAVHLPQHGAGAGRAADRRPPPPWARSAGRPPSLAAPTGFTAARPRRAAVDDRRLRRPNRAVPGSAPSPRSGLARTPHSTPPRQES